MEENPSLFQGSEKDASRSIMTERLRKAGRIQLGKIFALLIFCFFLILHISEIIYLSFSHWLISLRIIP